MMLFNRFPALLRAVRLCLDDTGNYSGAELGHMEVRPVPAEWVHRFGLAEGAAAKLHGTAVGTLVAHDLVYACYHAPDDDALECLAIGDGELRQHIHTVFGHAGMWTQAEALEEVLEAVLNDDLNAVLTYAGN